MVGPWGLRWTDLPRVPASPRCAVPLRIAGSEATFRASAGIPSEPSNDTIREEATVKLSPALPAALFVAALLATGAQAEDEYAKADVNCTMEFNLGGWSLAFKKMDGKGEVTCSNGQTATVELEARGVGFTIGKSEITGGEATFSAVKDISEIFGSYASADASGSATKGKGGQVMTKGEISMAMGGDSRGMDIGVSIGAFTIKQK